MKTILGIDVGIKGALSFYDGNELMIYDMPVFRRNKTSRIACQTFLRILNDNHVTHAYIEQVNAFGMGATGAYNFGWNCGVVEALVASQQIPFSYVTPQKWKKVMQCPKSKDAARMRASQLFPNETHQWDLKKHDGRAEASIIALYGFKNEGRT